jgi:hypothetical protein
MRSYAVRAAWRLLPLGLLLAAAGCDVAVSERPEPRPADKPRPAPVKKVLVGPNVFLEFQGDARRVLVSAEICLRTGMLEVLLCKKPSKEHESILTADVDGRVIHKALNLAGAVEGGPVQFVPKYKPAHGATIKVFVQYEKDGKLHKVPAQDWIRNAKTRRSLESDWVFAGSRLVPNPVEPEKNPPLYLANTDGYFIGVSNFETALLDLPIRSPKDNADLIFEAFTDRIPAEGTKCVVVLEPVPPAKK